MSPLLRFHKRKRNEDYSNDKLEETNIKNKCKNKDKKIVNNNKKGNCKKEDKTNIMDEPVIKTNIFDDIKKFKDKKLINKNNDVLNNKGNIFDPVIDNKPE